ncbi:MAG: SEC-C metal-binding domain-containing protein, partial [Chloroflexota bacterium]
QENEEEGLNIYQMLQALSRFIPMMPAIPNLGTVLSRQKGNHLQTKANVQKQFTSDVRYIYDNFLADYAEEADREALWQQSSEKIEAVFNNFNVQRATPESLRAQNAHFRKDLREILQELLVESLSTLTGDELEDALHGHIDKERNRWRERIGDELFSEFQRTLVLSAIDREWRDYLTAADDLRREIGLESAGRQKDPKVEYKKRSYEMFADMRNNIQREIADKFFTHIRNSDNYMRQQKEAEARQEQLSRAGYQVVQNKGKNSTVRKDSVQVGRNDLCPCGSGKKYKNCHMKTDLQNGGAVVGNGVSAPEASNRPKPVQKVRSGTKPKKKRRKR